MLKHLVVLHPPTSPLEYKQGSMYFLCVFQGSAVLRQSLISSEGELARLQSTCLQLLGDLRGKRAAAQVDAAVVRMRRQLVDKRAMPSFLQQEVGKSQLSVLCVE